MSPFFLLLALGTSVAAPQPAEAHARANQSALVREFVDALSIPDVASDRANIRRKAEFLRGRFEAGGFKAETLQTTGNPLVWAEMKALGARRTLLLYAHYDGQPVDPKGWKQESPFKPILRNGKMGRYDAIVIPPFGSPGLSEILPVKVPSGGGQVEVRECTFQEIQAHWDACYAQWLIDSAPCDALPLLIEQHQCLNAASRASNACLDLPCTP